ncbi:MAG: hypothetical protein M3Q65_03050 [Chloroflexota bacterium]|nr:hypothetical protein [Chloroflexota bacterium]
MADHERLREATDADIQSLADKLQRFSDTLTPVERAILTDLLERATAEDEVQGFGIAEQRYQMARNTAFNPHEGFGGAGLVRERRSPFLSAIFRDRDVPNMGY